LFFSQAFGNDAYLHTGLYTFMTGPDGDRKPVEARFSYMWRKISGEWKITHHHSSALPGATKPDAKAEIDEDMYPLAQVPFHFLVCRS
jgi:ketosteroid isomerase-like protein